MRCRICLPGCPDVLLQQRSLDEREFVAPTLRGPSSLVKNPIRQGKEPERGSCPRFHLETYDLCPAIAEGLGIAARLTQGREVERRHEDVRPLELAVCRKHHVVAVRFANQHLAVE